MTERQAWVRRGGAQTSSHSLRTASLLRRPVGVRSRTTRGYTNEPAGSSDSVNPARPFLQEPWTPEALARALRNALDPDRAPVPQAR